jgi:RNA polymerase sigma factor (sigma-70 family)
MGREYARADSIEEVYRKYGHSVLRRARVLMGNDHEAEDVMQEVFAAYVEDPNAFRQRSSVLTWLYAATTHRCLNRLRDGRTRARLLAEHTPKSVECRSAEAISMVRQLLLMLPVDLATVAVYHYVDGFTQDEMARVMGCSRRHAGNLINRLRARWEEQRKALR